LRSRTELAPKIQCRLQIRQQTPQNRVIRLLSARASFGGACSSSNNQCNQQHALSDGAHQLTSGAQLGAPIMMIDVYNSVGLQPMDVQQKA
jgi:hypothetical protein